jgi:hypothetical protein
VAFGVDQSGDDTTQGYGGAPSGLSNRPDSRVDGGLARQYRLRATPSHRSHRLVGTSPRRRLELSRRAGRFRAAR